MTTRTAVSRRTFLVSTAAAGGLALGWQVPFDAIKAFAQTPMPPPAGQEVGIWVVIHPDDKVVVRIARSEMGQGTLTGLAQLVAEDLDCGWSKVSAEYVRPDENLARKRAWGDMSTGGSRGIRASVDYVRKGGAVARAMLIEAAAKRLGVPAGELSAANSVVSHKASGRTLRYGELAPEAAKLDVPKDVALKAQKDWTLVGKGVKRLDTAEKLDGKLVYAIDLKLPGMLNASIAQSPVFGGKLVSFDADKVKGLPGVKHVVAVGTNAVAVVADTWWHAHSALQKLPIVWDEGSNGKVDDASIAVFLKEGLDAAPTQTGQKIGDAGAAIAGAAKKIEATYGAPFLNHATLEPMTCTAKIDGDKVEIWVPSQNGDASLAAAGEAAGVPLANVRVNKLHLGGGFGRRGFQDYTRQAVLLAKQVPGVPIKLIWSREEDMQHGFYRPVTMCKLTGGLDAAGNLVGLHIKLSGQSILASLGRQDGLDRNFFQGLLEDEWSYDIPNLLIDWSMRNTHVPVGFWRGVNHNQNAVYKECFMDELASAAVQDPYQFRRKLLGKQPKHLAVLDEAAKKSGWSTPAASGVHRGIALNHGFGTYGATVAEVSVDAKGKVKVHRIVMALDSGYIVNPDQCAAQSEGGMAYGLGATLYSENTIKNGRVVEGNFDSYEVLRLEDMPKVEVSFVNTGGFWGGIGEPLTPLAAPAVLNAIFAATGKRIRTLPIKHHKLV